MTDSNPQESPQEDVPSYHSLLDLTGRNYVVLGAGQGMGRQSAHALSQAGARVVCVDRDEVLARTVARELDGHPHVADVTVGSEIAELFDDTSARLGAVHGVVDVVGFASSGPFVDTDEALWDAQFDIVVRHAYHTIRSAAPHLEQAGGGSMVFIGSLAGVMGIPRQAIYGAAKAALHHLARITALELGSGGTRVNVIAPGFVKTPRLAARIPEDGWQSIAASIPNRRVATTSDIAAAVLFLSSPMARHITGQVLSVDGGTSSLVGMPPLQDLLGL